MPANLVMHGEFSDNYDDPDHPIPSITAIDVNTVKRRGGSDLIIVVAKPMIADRYSMERLLSKIELYLKFMRTQEFISESGVASPENTSIVAMLAPGSAPEIHTLLEQSKAWVLANNATLKVEELRDAAK